MSREICPSENQTFLIAEELEKLVGFLGEEKYPNRKSVQKICPIKESAKMCLSKKSQVHSLPEILNTVTVFSETFFLSLQ